ncbi:MAG: hypothetical protein NTV62_03515, partial [Candidatus Gribaldobacteria bacterium]|nr:hypothetical protein [Candidatus Gribaldobacteria bacterium]
FLARILIVVFLVAILGIIFFVWKSGFKFNFSPQVNPKATSSENIAPNPELPIKNGIDLAPTSSEDTIINESTSSESIVENNPSADLLSFIKTKILTLGQATDTADLFKIAMTESESVDSLIRVVVKDETSGDYLDDLRVLESLGFILKDEVSSLLNPEGNVFIYYGKQGARLGFIFSTTNKDALQVKMKEWEASLPTDIFSLLNWQAGDQISLASSFKGATKNNRSFRYLDVVPASRDMGVCYGVVGDYFVFTTAGSAMLKVLQILP